MSHAQARNQACQLAGKDNARALTLASKIADPWYACQAMACVVREESDVKKAVVVARRAIKRASESEDVYRATAVLAWPFRELAVRGLMRSVAQDFDRALEATTRIPNWSSRTQALLLIFGGVHPAGEGYWRPVFDALVSEPKIEHWRHGRNVRDAILVVAREDPDLAREAAGRLEECKAKRQIMKGLRRD